MSPDRPPEGDPHRDRLTDEYTSDRDRSYPGDVARLNGHEFVAIDEWLPGAEPTPDDYAYRELMSVSGRAEYSTVSPRDVLPDVFDINYSS